MSIPDHFVTPRLLVRCPQPGDGPLSYAAILASFDELHAWMSWAKERPSLEFLEKRAVDSRAKFQAGTQIEFIMILTATGEFIGKCGLHDVNRDTKTVELGYWCHSAHVGHGYVTEAVGGMIDWARQHLGLTQFAIRCDERNVKSQGVALRLGFELQGRIVNDDFDHTGTLRNTLIFARG